MYALTIDLDLEKISSFLVGFTRKDLGRATSDMFREIADILSEEGFTPSMSIGLYYGGPEVTVVKCVLASMRVSKECSWFLDVVQDIRMMRVEESNDILPLLLW